MAKKMKRSTTEDESSRGNSASSSEDISREETARRRRRRSQARRNASKKERSYSQGKEIIKFLAEVKEEVCKQSKQVAESKEEMSKQLEKLRVEMCKQLKQVTESKEEMYKQLDKLREEMCKQSKQTTEILTDLRKQWDLHTNGSSGDDSDAPRSQSNPVQPPRYRLVLKSGVTDKIGKGEPIDISVALVDGNDQTVENGPLASATVELVVVNAEFNQHNNQHNWSREDFEINIKKAQQGNSATVDVDQSLKSIVSDGRFNLVQGVKCHSGSKIFRNSGNKKVRLGVMVVSPTEERVLEGLSNPFFVRGHDRLRHNNRLNTQRQPLVYDGYEEQNVAVPNMQNPSWANSTQSEEIRSNITGGPPQFSIIGNTTMLSPGLNITGGQPQLPFLGNTTMLSTEPPTSQDEEASIQQYQLPHLPMSAQDTNNQTDELSAALVGNVKNPNIMGNDYVPVQAIGTPYYTIQRALPVRLIWDRLIVEPIKHCWNLLDQLNVTTVTKPSNKKMSRLKGQFPKLEPLILSSTVDFTFEETVYGVPNSIVDLEKISIISLQNPDPTRVGASDTGSTLYRQPRYRFPKYMQDEVKSLVYMPLENIGCLRINLCLSQHLTKLHLFGLMWCEELPKICQLQVLQILCLEKLDKLRSLCSHMVSTLFPELRELRLHDLKSLEKWVATEGKEEQLIFPVLEKIVIKKCPKLTRLPEAPKLKDRELDEGKSPLSLALVQLRHMYPVRTLVLSTHDTEATRPHQIDQNHDSSISELDLKGLPDEDRDVSHASFKQSTQRNDVRPRVPLHGVVV